MQAKGNTTFSELKRREVINVCDGARLGNVCDLELDMFTGTVHAIIVPGESKMLGILKCGDDTHIPFCKITKLGEDVILVDIR
ncbi:MAG: YlmC/YmxH family sporulation protein [Clostridiales bacterium]|nr:YlmC/YmxH family sporulation protein [Clostridiales bacterium]